MCEFLVCLLEKDLQFSQEHLDEMKHKLETAKENNQRTESYFYHNDQIFFGAHGSHISDENKHGYTFHFGEGRYCLVFNGKVYNDEKLRLDLQQKGYIFSTKLPHEVIGIAFIEYGIDAFSMLRGMFSILIWDHLEQTVYGARDHLGMKPLYYMEGDHEVVFGSDKRNVMFPPHEYTVDEQALQHYLTYQYVPEPLTLHEGVHKLQPGYCLIKKVDQKIRFHRYFHARFHPKQTDCQELMKQIRMSLIDAVSVQMKSDLPLGSLLSGGIDSTIIVALAKEVNPNLKTFSAGFNRAGYSEVDIAKRTADQLGVENISYMITPEEYVNTLPEIMLQMEDPLADPSCVPLYIVMREARKHVNTVLSGEGADELFGGYNIYREPESLKVFEKIPASMNNLLHRVASVFPEGMKGKSFLERGTTPLKDRYIGNAKMFEEEEKRKILTNYNEGFTFQQKTKDLYAHVAGEHAVHQMQYIDIHTWLPGDILLKAEKMSKAHSLELRAPFLDQKVFQVAQQIPVDKKLSHGKTKLILREAFEGFVPDEILYRKKLGFPVPIKYWLKNELYPWARKLIFQSKTDDLIDKGIVLQLLERHRRSKNDYSRRIWTVLMFMLWHQIYMD